MGQIALDYNKVVTHLDQGLWKETELKRTSAIGRKQTCPLTTQSGHLGGSNQD